MSLIRVLTVKEPWASLIGEKIKTIETRSWPTKYRGTLYIHAGKKKISKLDEKTLKCMGNLKNNLHYGQIFLKCNLVDCVEITEHFVDQVKLDSMQNYYCGNFSIGRYAWILQDIEYISNPIQINGQLNIWKYELKED